MLTRACRQQMSINEVENKKLTGMFMQVTARIGYKKQQDLKRQSCYGIPLQT